MSALSSVAVRVLDMGELFLVLAVREVPSIVAAVNLTD